MIRIGVLGAGRHSRVNHGPTLERCSDERPSSVDLRAVCDLDSDRADQYADRFGFATTYTSIERMLAVESLDAVVAVTPIEATREVAGELLAREVPTLVEKPPGASVQEARELHAIATRHDTPHMVSFNRRFNPAVRRAREWIAENAPDRPPTHALARLLRTGRYEDGFIEETGIHAVDTVCSVLGRPTRVTARQWRPDVGSADRGGGSDRGTRCASRADFAAASAQFTFVSDAGTHAETYELFGPEYVIRIDAAASRYEVSVDGETVATWRAADSAPKYERNGTLGETRAFLEAVRHGEVFTPTLSDVLPSVEMAAVMEDGGDHEFGDGRD